MSAAITILCPLKVEARAIRAPLGVRVRTTGPGPAAVSAAIDALTPFDSGALMILAGLAGGLSPSVRTGAVLDARRVIDLEGHAWTAPDADAALSTAPATILGADEPAATVERKRELRESTGADAIDCESHAFARACEVHRVRWSILRAVSDADDESLPPGAASLHDGWTTPDGGTRVGRVLLDAARSPTLIPQLIRLRRSTNLALRNLNTALNALLDRERQADAAPLREAHA